MSSGVLVSPDCLDKYSKLKTGQFRSVLFKITDIQIVVEKTLAPTAQYQDFLNSLPAAKCRYAVYDFPYVANDGSKKNKLVFIQWTPDTASTKEKMLYTSSKDAIRKSLVGLAETLIATELSEISKEEVTNACKD